MCWIKTIHLNKWKAFYCIERRGVIVRKNKLFIISGLIWILAGSLVSRIGIKAFLSEYSLIITFLAGVIYMLFHIVIFSKIIRKNEKRIMDNSLSHLPWHSFFDRKGYLTMAFFITFGTVLRKSNLIPQSFFAFFYTGLGLALITSGISFIYLSFKHKLFDK